jgi:hypothetical protein
VICVLEIDVTKSDLGRPPPAQKAAKADWTNGFRGEHLDAGFGEYTVSVQTVPEHRVLSQSTITLSADHPVRNVRLLVATDSLTCAEGWWSAC